jgi:hypothetical protein
LHHKGKGKPSKVWKREENVLTFYETIMMQLDKESWAVSPHPHAVSEEGVLYTRKLSLRYANLTLVPSKKCF